MILIRLTTLALFFVNVTIALDCIALRDVPLEVRNNKKTDCTSPCQWGSCRIFGGDDITDWLACDNQDVFRGVYPRLCSDEEVTRELECVQIINVPDSVLNHGATNCQSNNDCHPNGSCRDWNKFLACDDTNNFSGQFQRLCEDVSVRTTELDCVQYEDVNRDALFGVASNCWGDNYCGSQVSCRAYPNCMLCDEDNTHAGKVAGLCPSIEI